MDAVRHLDAGCRASWRSIPRAREKSMETATLFKVRAGPDEAGDGMFEVEKTTKGAALETAWGLRRQGFKAVVITDQTGQVFEPEDFAAFWGDGT